MDYLLINKTELMLFIAFLIIAARTNDLFIKEGRKYKLAYIEKVNTQFIGFVLVIFPMTLFFSNISIKDFDIKKLLIYISYTFIVMYYVILLIHYFKSKRK